MPSVSSAKYGAQSLAQLQQVVQQLALQKSNIADKYNPGTPQAAAPQTPFQGLMSGVIGEHNRRREDVKLQEDNALQQSLAILDLIPDTPENTPKKLQLLTSILHPKTQKGWKEVWNPQADHTAQAQFLQKFSAQLPTDDEVQQQQGAAPASRVRSVAEQGEGYVAPSQKFQFPDDGQYQGGQIIQTADGLVMVTVDKKTGEPKLKPLGQGKTEKQSVQQLKNEGRGASAENNPAIKRAIAYAQIAANEAEGIAYSDFAKLKQDDPERYQQYMAIGNAKAKEYLDAQNAAAGLRVPYLQAKTKEALANEQRGGVTGGQAATILRQDRDDVVKANQAVTEATAEVQRLQTLKNNIWDNWQSKNPTTPPEQLEAEMFNRKSTRPEVVEYRKITSDLIAAQTKLKAAEKTKTTVGKSVPRGGKPLTGTLDIDRMLRQAPPATGDPGGQHYVVQDPTAAQLQIPAGFNLDSEPLPETTTGLRSVGRSFKNPNVFIMNPARFGLRPNSLVKGARLDTEKGVFEVMDVSADKTKVLVHKIPE